MAGRKSDTVFIKCPDLVYQKAEVELTEQPRKKRAVLDSPYNPMGMEILNAAHRGMAYQGDKRAGNKRAERMQAAIEDVQTALNPDDDTRTTKEPLMS